MRSNPKRPLSLQVAEAIDKIIKLEDKFPGIIQHELFDLLDVLEMGAVKYAANNWLAPNGKKSSLKDMHASMFRHLAQSSVNEIGNNLQGRPVDAESGLPPELHLACRALMVHTRRSRGIKHEDDK